MKKSCVVVDDEPEVRQLLVTLIEKYAPGFQVIGLAGDSTTAFRLITDLKPDIVLLDVSMPGEDGFQLLERFANPGFEVVFITAYDAYALQALKLSAIDYLLKPVDITELQVALSKCSERILEKQQLQHFEQMSALLPAARSQKMALPVANGFRYVNVNDIVRCESHSNYTSFHFKNKETELVSQTMKAFSGFLEQCGFMRVHRSHLINIDCVKEYHRDGRLVMLDGSHVEVSFRQRQMLMNRLKRQ